MSTSINFICVAIGGAAGACLRYAITMMLSDHAQRFPAGTLFANLLGALMAGLIVTWFWHRGLLGSPLQLVLVVGFLGGFTTFSAFSVETLRLAETGNLPLAGLNIVLNVAGSLLAVFLGAWLARMLLAE